MERISAVGCLRTCQCGRIPDGEVKEFGLVVISSLAFGTDSEASKDGFGSRPGIALASACSTRFTSHSHRSGSTVGDAQVS